MKEEEEEERRTGMPGGRREGEGEGGRRRGGQEGGSRATCDQLPLQFDSRSHDTGPQFTQI